MPHYRTILILGFGLSVLAGCGAATAPEEAVLAWLGEAESAVEDRDRGRLVAMISESYVDSRGNDRESIDGLVRALFLRHRNILLATNIEELTIVGGTAAKVVLTAGMAGMNGGTSGFAADAYRFELELANDGDEWLLIGARWGETGRNPR